jgi:cytosine/uracil/thiamine/allantoin permease
VPALKPLLPYGWFVGFFASGLLYWALSASRQPERMAEPAGATGV